MSFSSSIERWFFRDSLAGADGVSDGWRLVSWGQRSARSGRTAGQAQSERLWHASGQAGSVFDGWRPPSREPFFVFGGGAPDGWLLPSVFFQGLGCFGLRDSVRPHLRRKKSLPCRRPSVSAAVTGSGTTAGGIRFSSALGVEWSRQDEDWFNPCIPCRSSFPPFWPRRRRKTTPPTAAGTMLENARLAAQRYVHE
jgi:hypothetical protein